MARYNNSTSISQPGTVFPAGNSSSTGPSARQRIFLSVSGSKELCGYPYGCSSAVRRKSLCFSCHDPSGAGRTNGGTPLISGNYSGYSGYYNFFNVEAYQSGSMSATQMGLRYASQSGSYGRPWNTVEKSILGGAQNYGDNYVKAGQNTFYLKSSMCRDPILINIST